MEKVRRIDYWPDEMIAGVAGQLDPEEFGVYWMVCTLIYSRGGAIKDDPDWVAGVFRKTSPRTIRTVLERLVSSGKVSRNGGELVVNRCRTEIERTLKRARTWRENGSNGGRPSNENNDIDKPSGYPDQDVDNNRFFNYQPPTSNQEETPYSPPEGGGSPDGEHTGQDLLGDAPTTKPRRKRGDGADRGTRVPEGDLPEEWSIAANHSRERHELPLLNKRVLNLRWTSFQNFWRGRPGSKGLKSDWRATWLNDCIDNRTEKRFPPDVAATARAPKIDTTG